MKSLPSPSASRVCGFGSLHGMGVGPSGRGNDNPTRQGGGGDLCGDPREGFAGWGGWPGVKVEEVPIWAQPVASHVEHDD